jgi:hypothetical protein
LALAAAVVSWATLKLMPASHLDLTWRLCIAVGAIPGLLTFSFRYYLSYLHSLAANSILRLTMSETERFGNADEAPVMQKWWALLRQYWRRLVGTAGTWFNIILALAAVPGYWTAVYLIETLLGRKSLQTLGFLLMAARSWLRYVFLSVEHGGM